LFLRAFALKPSLDFVSAEKRLCFHGNNLNDNRMFFRKKKSAAKFVPVALPAPAEPDMDSRKKVLVIDDDPVIVKAVTLALHARGYRVLSALDGAEAIDVFREKNPDVLLVDVHLPPDAATEGAVLSDGFQVTRWLQLANSRKVPTIIMSGSDKPEFKRLAASLGAVCFMTKPLNSATLVKAIEVALVSRGPKGHEFDRKTA
jgi:CheY-like chemotaxis protein